MHRVLVIGSQGMLGRAVSCSFARQGYETTPIGRAEFDIARDPMEKILPLLQRHDVVVNCSGVIKPRIGAMPIEDVLRVNAIFPRNLARVCAGEGVQLFHVTTDCVYSGRKGGYDERALVDAEDVYGLSKSAGEPADCMVLRTSIIGEESGPGRSLLAWAMGQRGQQVNGFVNHRWNGVTTVYLADLVRRILQDNAYSAGTYHLFSPRTVTKQELVTLLSDVYGLGLTVVPVEAKEACDRSLASIFPLSRRIATKDIVDQVREMKTFFGS